MPALNPTENTFGEDPDAPLRVAKMQDVHSLLVFRFAAKLSPVHSFLLRGLNFAEVLFFIAHSFEAGLERAEKATIHKNCCPAPA